MEEVLIVVLQLLLEFVVDCFLYTPFSFGRIPDGSTSSLVTRCTLLFATASALAGVSLLLFRHTIISIGLLRILNLIFAPIVSGLVFQAIAARRARGGARVVPREQFWQAFWFTLGWMLIRFAFAQRR